MLRSLILFCLIGFLVALPSHTWAKRNAKKDPFRQEKYEIRQFENLKFGNLRF